MSVQFGRWNMDREPVDPGYLQKAEDMLAPYGPDGEGAYIKDSVGILYRAFHTTKESRRESQPLVTPSGTAICWDGRLDNRAELIHGLKDFLTAEAADVEIVAVVYELWGTECFAKLIGDWALAIWSPSSPSVILAKDFVGTRKLYYSVEKDQVTWSSILDPLILLTGKALTLEEEYIAGWLSFFPATHLTPYVGIHSVPPSSFVRLEPGRRTVYKYWDFDPCKRIRYRTDGEYEEHFRQVFGESVKRRLRSDSPVLAELSGGMDSSSIVCMADTLIAGGAAETPRLDTVSYYNDSEPNWNERPYFTKVEEKRGRTGRHIAFGREEFFLSRLGNDRFTATPDSGSACLCKSSLEFAACLTLQGNHVVLSGIGGDEVTGGVPTPMPELEDLLARAHFGLLARQLKLWALSKRKPWVHFLLEACRGFAPPALVGISKQKRAVPWLHPAFVSRNREALQGYESRIKLFGPLPSYQENISTLTELQRQLVCNLTPSKPVYEKRYPYLDRGFLEFVFAIPREQLVRPGERRSLTRRALAGIVPAELLTRKRKAFLVRAPLAAIADNRANLMEMSQDMVSSSLGIITPNLFAAALGRAYHGQEVPIISLMRTASVESWLRNLSRCGVLLNNPTGVPQKSMTSPIGSPWPEIGLGKRNSTRVG